MTTDTVWHHLSQPQQTFRNCTRELNLQRRWREEEYMLRPHIGQHWPMGLTMCHKKGLFKLLYKIKCSVNAHESKIQKWFEMLFCRPVNTGIKGNSRISQCEDKMWRYCGNLSCMTTSATRTNPDDWVDDDATTRTTTTVHPFSQPGCSLRGGLCCFLSSPITTNIHNNMQPPQITRTRRSIETSLHPLKKLPTNQWTG